MTEESVNANRRINELLEKIKVSAGNFNYGLSLQKVLTDEAGQPVDFEFIFTNTLFGELIGSPANILKGKKATEIFPEIKQSKFNWVEVLGQIGLNYGKAQFYHFSEKHQKWFLISVYCPEIGYIIINLKYVPDLKAIETQIHSIDSLKWLIDEYK
jgi:hypothetical protein